MSEKTVKALKKIYLPLFFSLLFAFLCNQPLQISASKTTVFYQVQLKKLHPDVLSSLIAGAPLTDSISKSPVGKIESVSVTPHMTETYSSSHDRMTQAPHPFFRDVTLTVRALCTPKKNGYGIGSFTLFSGASLHFFTPLFTGVGECTAIYESERVR